jgi:DNA-binding transcriptional regulator YhcF (GntR family)
MTARPSGHVEELPSGSFRVSVYAETDPLTGRQLRHRETAKTLAQAQIALGRLLEQAEAGRRPDSRILVKELLSRYLQVADLEASTRVTYDGYIRRTIPPAIGAVEVRKVRGPMLDTLYARLRRCSDLTCGSGRPFIEHNSFPTLSDDRNGRFQRWQQIASQLRDAIAFGELAPGRELPSVRDLATRYGPPLAAVRHAVESLTAEGLVVARPGRSAIVHGPLAHTPSPPNQTMRRLRPGDGRHDCSKAGCRTHTCKPMSASTIRQIHSILSGAFAAAVRWVWIDRNPAASARLPKSRPFSPASPEPAAVAKAIAAARAMELDLLALYLSVARRGHGSAARRVVRAAME